MRTLLTVVAVILVLAAAGAALFARQIWARLHEPYKGYSAAEQFVDIPPGTSTADIGRRLIAAGIVRDKTAFRAALWWSNQSRSLQAGEYRFDSPITVLDAIDRLSRGDVYTRRLTFPEGLTIQEMATIYESQGFGAAREFVQAAGDAALVTDLDPQARDLEGYLFPETYALPRRAAAPSLVALMVDRFRATFTDDLRRAAEEQDLTVRQVLTLASLVEKETGKADERPVIAAVYRNRLRIGMPMQADPTVVYAMQKAGRYNGNIRRDDLGIDSPYNTYKYRGLPPGPIASPGKASLEAALTPADVPYLYFVSRNDGSHVFASTLAEHNRNVRQYQVLFFQSGGRGRGEGGRAVSGNRR